jgi:hypothetical protein
MTTSLVKSSPTQTRRALNIRSLPYGNVQNFAAPGHAD